MTPEDSNQPATKADLRAIADQITAFVERVDAKIEQVDAKIERVETNLLTAFYKWASPTDIKLRSSQMEIASLNERLSLIEERVRDLESGRRAS